MAELNLPVVGKSTLIGQTGILVAYGPGNPHPVRRGWLICVSLYAMREGLVICLSEDVADGPCGFESRGIGGEVPMDLLIPFAERFVKPLPSTKLFKSITQIHRTEFPKANWEVISYQGYRAACQQLQANSRN